MMTTQLYTEKYDVVICGAGPSGSTCALELEKAGLKVAIIEKEIFPRNKICGDGILASAPKILETIDPKYAGIFENSDEVQIIRTTRYVAPNEKVIDVNWKSFSYTCSRSHFDQLLLNYALQAPNVKVYFDTCVKDVTVTDAGVVIKTNNSLNIEAKLVIGCDGSNSIVKRKLTDTKVDVRHYGVAVRAYYKNVTDVLHSTIELHFIKGILPGYFWIFPISNNTYNVGLGNLSSVVSKEKINLKKCFESILEIPSIKKRFKAAEIIGNLESASLPLGSRKVAVAGNRFMLCGDAASLIDPLSGDGITQAMLSGRNAGWQAIKCFERNDFSASFMNEYSKTLDDIYRKRFYKHYLIQRFIGKPWVINCALNLATKSKGVQNLLKKAID